MTKYSSILQLLSEKRVYLVTPLVNGGVLRDYSFTDSRDLEILDKLVLSDFIQNYNKPVVIDMVKAVSLFSGQKKGSLEERVESALMLSRFSFMGTDGMRGKISTDESLDPIIAFLADNLLTPQMIELTSYAFGKMLQDNGSVNSTACVGNDGRDITTDWALNSAMITGFNSANFEVLDIGISPTPFVPYKMLKESFSAGAVLTASHNPANQNGIKYFFNGKKILPEGKIGDYSFAAWVYDAYLNGYKESNSCSFKSIDLEEEVLSFMSDVIPSEITENLEHSYIILDSANGAFHDLSVKMLDKLGIGFTLINDEPNGVNINKSCGVAEVEGKEEFLSSDYDGALTIIKRVFDKGRNSSKTVFGVVLDGDGDRGFVLVYEKKTDKVLVIDGDKSGYIMALYYKSKGLDFNNLNFVTTVESDIMTAVSANEILSLETPIVSVGDKWIGAFDSGELLLGLESSGHLIFPIKYESTEGKTVELRAGNGLLTALMTLTGITSLKLSAKKAFEPYEAGFSKTFYTYFVDKTLFYRGSSVWNSDSEILLNEFEKLKEKKVLSQDCSLTFEIKEDSHMLYASIKKSEVQIAAIFCRNSGTEDKAAVYVKCKEEFEKALLPIGISLRDNHVKNMKNHQRKEYRQEVVLLNVLATQNDLSIIKLKEILELNYNEKVSETDLYSVVYGLKKEGRVSFENSLINII